MAPAAMAPAPPAPRWSTGCALPRPRRVRGARRPSAVRACGYLALLLAVSAGRAPRQADAAGAAARRRAGTQTRRALRQASVAGGDAATQVVVQGAGASFPNVLYQDAVLAYAQSTANRKNTKVTYTSTGSSRGKCRIKDAAVECKDSIVPQQVDFACSDSLLKPSEYEAYPDLQMYPTVAGAIALVYNLPGVADGELVVTGEVMARIFLGNITRWDDDALTSLNPKLKLPAERMQVAVRSDGSGTTEVWTKTLSGLDATFRATVGISSKPAWTGLGDDVHMRDGNTGVAHFVAATPYSVSYCVLGDTLKHSLSKAAFLPNGAAEPVQCNEKGIENAVLEKGSSFGNNGDPPERLTADIMNANSPRAWPAVTYTYLILRTGRVQFEAADRLRDGATCEHVRRTLTFWNWFLESGVVKGIASLHGFVTPPRSIQAIIISRLNSDLWCNGERVLPTSWTANMQEDTLAKFQVATPSVVELVLSQMTWMFHSTNESVTVDVSARGGAEAGELLAKADLSFAGHGTESLLRLPSLLVNTGVAVNPGVLSDAAKDGSQQLNLTHAVLYRIITGEISSWDDPTVTAMNPWLLQDRSDSSEQRPIVVVTPSSASGFHNLAVNRLRSATAGGADGANASWAPSRPRETPQVTPHELERRHTNYVRLGAQVVETPYSIALIPLVGSLQRLRVTWAVMQTDDDGTYERVMTEDCIASSADDTSSVDMDKLTRSCGPMKFPLHLTIKGGDQGGSTCAEPARWESTYAMLRFVEWLYRNAQARDVFASSGLTMLWGERVRDLGGDGKSAAENYDPLFRALYEVTCRGMSYLPHLRPPVVVAAPGSPPPGSPDRMGAAATAGIVMACLLAAACIVGSAAWRIRTRLVDSMREQMVRSYKLRNRPGGDGVTIVVTDIQASTQMWQTIPEHMNTAQLVHDALLREELHACCGYEFMTEGDSFQLAFHDPADALDFATRIQERLHSHAWDKEVVDACETLYSKSNANASEFAKMISNGDNPNGESGGSGIFAGSQVQYIDSAQGHGSVGSRLSATIPGNGLRNAEGRMKKGRSFLRVTQAINAEVGEGLPQQEPSVSSPFVGDRSFVDGQPFLEAFRGLRVRVGVHVGDARKFLHPTTRRFMYEGAAVQRAKAVCDAASGGQILITGDVLAALSAKGAGSPEISSDFGRGKEFWSSILFFHMGSHQIVFTKQANAPVTEEGDGDLDSSFSSERGLYDLDGSAKRNKATLSSEAVEIVQAVSSKLSPRLLIFPPLGTIRQLDASFFEAPDPRSPKLTIVFTYIDGSTELQGFCAEEFQKAVELQNSLVRSTLPMYNGYECREIGGNFLLAFHNPEGALGWCCEVQAKLLRKAWPSALLRHPKACRMRLGDQYLFTGLRVAMGVCAGQCTDVRPCRRTARAEYFGHILNLTARIANSAHGGQVVCEASTWEMAKGRIDLSMLDRPVRLGQFAMKGIVEKVECLQILPVALCSRIFPPLKAERKGTKLKDRWSSSSSSPGGSSQNLGQLGQPGSSATDATSASFTSNDVSARGLDGVAELAIAPRVESLHELRVVVMTTSPMLRMHINRIFLELGMRYVDHPNNNEELMHLCMPSGDSDGVDEAKHVLLLHDTAEDTKADDIARCRLVRQHVPFARQPFIAMLGDHPDLLTRDQEWKEYCVANGADAAITGPFDLEKVKRVLSPLTWAHHRSLRAKEPQKEGGGDERAAERKGEHRGDMPWTSLAPHLRGMAKEALGIASNESSNLIFVLDKELDVIYGNKAFLAATGVDMAQLQRYGTVEQFFCCGKLLWKFRNGVAGGKGPWTEVVRLATARRTFAFGQTSAEMPDADGILVMGRFVPRDFGDGSCGVVGILSRHIDESLIEAHREEEVAAQRRQSDSDIVIDEEQREYLKAFEAANDGARAAELRLKEAAKIGGASAAAGVVGGGSSSSLDSAAKADRWEVGLGGGGDDDDDDDAPREVGLRDADDARSVDEELSSIHSWDDFDVFNVEEQSGGNALRLVLVESMRVLGIFDALNIKRAVFERFAASLQEAYQANPYHCAMHAADVVQTVTCILMEGRQRAPGASAVGALRDGTPGVLPVQAFALLVAASIHDVGHLGLNNKFMIDAESPQAKRYHDQSVNENMHLEIGLKLLESPRHDVLAYFPAEERRAVRNMIIRMVLQTDMSFHGQLVARFVAECERNKAKPVHAWDDPIVALEWILHTSDISNPSRRLPYSVRWAMLLADEFFLQGDKEMELGMEVTPFCNRKLANVYKNQMGFIDVIVQPSFAALSNVVSPGLMERMLELLEVTRSEYASKSGGAAGGGAEAAAAVAAAAEEEEEEEEHLGHARGPSTDRGGGALPGFAAEEEAEEEGRS